MKSVLLGSVMCGLLLTAAARAESNASITAVGSASKTGSAKLLRMSVTATGEGNTAAEAVAALRKQTDAMKSKLSELKPVDGTLQVTDVRFGPPDGGLTPIQRQQQAMIRQMRGEQAKPAAEAKVVASSVVSAEFALDGGAGDDAMIKQYDTKQKIAEAMKSVKQERKLTPEQEEIMEEMAGMMDDSTPQPGEPSFTYVLPLTGDELAAVTRDAVADANRRATALAQAAGKKLGPIQSLRSGSAEPGDQMTNVYIAMMSGEASAEDNTTEAVSDAAGPITFTADVTVQYALE